MWPKEADRLKKHRGGRGETCTVWISVFSYADARTFSNHGQSRPQNPEQLCVCMCVCTCARVWIPMFVFHPAILLKKQWAEVKVNHSSPGYAIGLTKEDRDHFPHLGQDDTQRDHYICAKSVVALRMSLSIWKREGGNLVMHSSLVRLDPSWFHYTMEDCKQCSAKRCSPRSAFFCQSSLLCRLGFQFWYIPIPLSGCLLFTALLLFCPESGFHWKFWVSECVCM